MPVKNNLSLQDSVALLKGVGPETKRLLHKFNILTIEDLLRFLPRRYLDARNVVLIKEAQNSLGDPCIIKGQVNSLQTKKIYSKKMSVTNALIKDSSEQIECVWFNRPYMDKSYIGRHLVLYGKIVKNDFSGRNILDNPMILPESGIYPIYKKTDNLTDVKLRNLIAQALECEIGADELDEVARTFGLISFAQAAKSIHFPDSFGDFRRAKERFDYEGLTRYILAGQIINSSIAQRKAYKLENEKVVNDFITTLPFDLTKDQISTISDVNTDLASEKPSNRIIIGDVGVGKTVVAAAACINAVKSGKRVVWLAPTEILASQHFQFMTSVSDGFIDEIGLLTSSSKNKDDIAKSDLIIATHAAFYGSQKIKEIGLVIIDEQHRFGVAQREKLLKDRDRYPHFISMTATPIPRTIAHLLLGTLDISFIRTKPKARKEIKTYFVNEKKKRSAYEFVAGLLEVGQQAFVICPLIEEDESGELNSVKSELNKLKDTCLAKFAIKSLHGKMKQDEKNKIIKEFSQGKFQILVSTTVVEVGIDIADATIVMIEDAERFGLAQMHQIRGRVGRRNMQSYCLVYSNNLNEKTKKRLQTFCSTNDGFALAENDLKQRGPGSLLGFEQSGFADFNFSWLENKKLREVSRETAEMIMNSKENFPVFYKQARNLLLSEHLE